MGRVQGSLVVAGIVSASLAVLAAAPQAPQGEKKEEAATPRTRHFVFASPQIEMWGGSGVRLGVRLRDVDEVLAREHKLPAVDGVLVDSVDAGSAAEKAGIKAGDAIVTFDGERVRSARHLQRMVADTPVGREIAITVVRDGRKIVTKVKTERQSAEGQVQGFRLDELDRNLDRLRDLPRAFNFEWDEDQAPGDIRPMPRTPRQLPTPPHRPFGPRWPLNEWSSGAGRLGVTVQELTPQLGEYFGAKDGVLVSSVSEGSPAAQAGVKAGDVITTVNGKPVKDAESLVRMVREQPDSQDLSLGILRDHKAQTLAVKLLPGHRGKPI